MSENHPESEPDVTPPPQDGRSDRAESVEHASRQVDPSEQAEGLHAGLGENATGDIVIDAALQDLRDADSDDLDSQIEAGQRVNQTLQARLSDLGE